MKKCTSCGEKIHRSDNVCLYCGAVQKKKIDEKVIGVIIAILFAIGFLIYVFNKPDDKNKAISSEKKRELIEIQIKAENSVKNMLKDPDSVKFKDQIGPCGFYNAKNSFGAYTGFKRYVVYEDMNAIEDVTVNSEDMNHLWKTVCKY
ncbi:hypothetical protein [Acinetobacter soli]|uniref:hypothetical protein n=1 Tax=Acinetobacter soli TaxID=487316 RepID=UPI001ABC9583|nr:hypothetical protein [Acinetobacter soli]MBO3640906.1 hypothetical protein [Acinetobacter soli]